MNRHIIIEVKPGAWKRAVIEAALYAGIFFAMGYYGRPTIQPILERML